MPPLERDVVSEEEVLVYVSSSRQMHIFYFDMFHIFEMFISTLLISNDVQCLVFYAAATQTFPNLGSIKYILSNRNQKYSYVEVALNCILIKCHFE